MIAYYKTVFHHTVLFKHKMYDHLPWVEKFCQTTIATVSVYLIFKI